VEVIFPDVALSRNQRIALGIGSGLVAAGALWVLFRAVRG
jgi:hypothetical protein